jgi:hypothetical protein
MQTNPVRGSDAGASQASSAQDQPPEPTQTSRGETPRAGQRRSASAAGLEELGGASHAPRVSAEQVAPRSALVPEPSRTTLGLPPRPSSPELIVRTSLVGRATVLSSAAEALADPDVRSRLLQQGISTRSLDAEAQGALQWREAELTPLLEEGERAARPVARQMMPMAGAEYTAAMIGQALRNVPAFDSSGLPIQDADGRQRNLGSLRTDAGQNRSAPSTVQMHESSVINRLGAAYVAAVDAAAFPQEQRLSDAQRATLNMGRLGSALLYQSQVMAELVSALDDQGPRAAAFLSHAVPLRESDTPVSTALQLKRSQGRAGFVEAIRAKPDMVQRLVDAAHRGLTEEHACEEVAREGAQLLEELAAAGGRFASAAGKSHLRNMSAGLDELSRPGSPGMRWLLAQPPVT